MTRLWGTSVKVQTWENIMNQRELNLLEVVTQNNYWLLEVRVKQAECNKE